MIKSLLIIDDETAILYAYKRLFQSPELIVHTAKTMDEALALLRKYKYDVVITDLRLDMKNEFGGLRLAKFLKTFDKKVKVILATAYGNPWVKSKADETGVDLYIVKPIPLDELKEILAGLGLPMKKKIKKK
ncbi:MAG: response regulator [bacterium]|nr:response regulator [bacterium]